MNGINIDSTTNRLSINPNGIDVEKYAVPEKITVAESPSQYEYVEPVEFGEGRFGNPVAFDRLQHILQVRELASTNAVDVAEEVAGCNDVASVGFSAPEFSC